MQGDDDDDTADLDGTAVDTTPLGAKEIDPLASITRNTAAIAARLRDEALANVVSSTTVEALPLGTTQNDPLASITHDTAAVAAQLRDEALANVVSSTTVEALPLGATQIDPLASITHDTAAVAAQLRDEALANVPTTPDLEPLRPGAPEIDPLASIDPATAHAARQLRDEALASVRHSDNSDLELVGADSELDAQDHALIARLRALPPEGAEPNWRALEDSIRAHVRDTRPYVPWWQSWRYLVPVGALAMTAVIALIVVKVSHRTPDRTSLLTPPRDAGVAEPVDTSAREPREHAPALWLDGEALELDDIDPQALDGLAPTVLDETDEPDSETDDSVEAAAAAAADGILPITDYGWIDALDDSEVERAESWLARKRS